MITYVKITKYPGEAHEASIICPIAGGDTYVVTTDSVAASGKTYYDYDAYRDKFTVSTVQVGGSVANKYEKRIIVQNGEPDHGCIIKNITGLGEENITINSSDYAVKDGAYLNGTRWGTRNIVLTFLLVPSSNASYNDANNIENSRAKLYEYFPGKKKVGIAISSDCYGKERYIEGYVESVTPEIFSDEEEVEVSIICPNPYFYIRKKVYAPVTGHLSYLGNADAGCKIRLKVTRTDGDPGISNIVFDRSKIANYSVNGIIELSSELGKKYAKYYPVSGSPVDIMNAAGIGPYDWVYLQNGDNYINITYGGSPVSDDQTWPDEDIYVDEDTDTSGSMDYNLSIEFNESYGGV